MMSHEDLYLSNSGDSHYRLGVNMKIGIIGAMAEEINAIKTKMQVTGERTIGDRIYYTGIYESAEITLVFSRWGKVASASTVTTLINEFKSEFVIFTGVARAISPILNIGDVVVGDSLYQHDMNATPFFKRCEIPLSGKTFFTPKEEHVQLAFNASATFLSTLDEHIDSETRLKFLIFNPRSYIGKIASGDQFVTDAAKHEALNMEETKETLAVEMEGASVAQICEEHRVLYVIVRTISDKANHSSHVDFPAFVTEVASKYSERIVSGIVRGFKCNMRSSE